MSRPTQIIVAAARQALDDSGLPIPEDGADDMGVFIGSGTTSLPETEETMRSIVQGRRAHGQPLLRAAWCCPTCRPGNWASSSRLRGPNATVSSACAASSTAIGEAADMIRRGAARAMLAGGVEAPICELGLAAFSATRAMSTRNDDPARACRPFAGRPRRHGGRRGRRRCWCSNGSTMALARGAHIYAEVIGYGGSCDAFHIVAPDSTGRGAALAIGRGARQHRPGARGHRLHQRPRHGHRPERRDGDPRRQAGVRRPRLPHPDQRPSSPWSATCWPAAARSRRWPRSRPCETGILPADNQPPRARPGLRPGLRAQRGARRPDPRRPQPDLRLRRPERRRRLPPLGIVRAACCSRSGA